MDVASYCGCTREPPRFLGILFPRIKSGEETSSERTSHHQTTMSDQSNCLICDNRWPMPIVEYLTPTENNCKRCLLVFEQAEELLQVQPSAKSSHNIRGSSSHSTHRLMHLKLTLFLEAPTQIAATLINLARPLEALNFCLSSLDISNKACPAHPSYDRRSALDGSHFHSPSQHCGC